LYTASNHPLTLGANGGAAIYISTLQYVGFGTSVPANVIDVNGNVSIGYPGTSGPANGLQVYGQVTIGTSFPPAAYLAVSPAIVNSFTTGSLINPTYTVTSGTLYGEQITPAFNPPTGDTYTKIYGLYVAPTITPVGTGTVTTAYGAYIAGPVVASNTVTTAYGAYVAAPSGSGTITTSIALYADNLSVGSNFQVTNAGNVGIGSTAPTLPLEITLASTSYGIFVGSTITASTGVGIYNDCRHYFGLWVCQFPNIHGLGRRNL
jgi:hypothetical protein